MAARLLEQIIGETESYDMAMKNGDLAKSINKGCHAEDKKSSVCDIGDVERELK